MSHQTLSIILPVFNEAGNLLPLHEEIVAAVKPVCDDGFEILYVDDGSSDGSLQELTALAEADNRAKVISLRRNFGQTAAIVAGIEHATGDVIVLMDADRQNDPADIPKLLGKLAEGYDVVSGWRRDRHDVFLTRRLPSLCANWLIGKITGLRLHDYGCTLKAYRRELLQEVKLYGDMHRFIPVFAYWIGARVTEMVVQHRARTVGDSKYGMGRILRVVLDLFVLKLFGDYRTRPIHFFGGLGLLLKLAGVALAGFVLYEKYAFDVLAHRNPLLLLAVFLFLIGLNLLMLGLLAEMITRVYYESQDKQIYNVRQLWNIEPPKRP